MYKHLCLLLLVITLGACQTSSYRSDYPEIYQYLTDSNIELAQTQLGRSGEHIAELLQLAPINIHRHSSGQTWVWVEFSRSGHRSLAVQFADNKATSFNFYEE